MILIKPITQNLVFFIFMYLLGLLCILTTAERSYLPFFIRLFPELFLDIYILCFFLEYLSFKWKKTLRFSISLLLYIIAIIDLFCYIRIGSTITPCILQLVLDSNTTEATEFFNSYISSDIIISPVGLIFVLMFVHFFAQHKLSSIKFKRTSQHKSILCFTILFTLIICIVASIKNKYIIIKTWHYKTIGEVESYLASDYFSVRAQYLPIYRLAFSIHANRLIKHQIQDLIFTLNNCEVDSCSFVSPTIVLIIGESYNKHHSQLYGYNMPTTPYQLKRYNEGELFVFPNAITPYNLTSEVLKNAFSLNDLSQNEVWCNKPLFTTLFKKAGYTVSFISNEFIIKQQGSVSDFSGGMFLNNPILSTLQFDNRNSSTHKYDEDLITDYQSLCKIPHDHQLIIFSLIGQHIDYGDRYPSGFSYFKADDYKRKDLSYNQLRIVADYDNATLYNDYIIERIIRLFEKENAILIYMPDHGDECFDQIKVFGRLHSDPVTKEIAYNEYQIPFWIWCSNQYKDRHQEITNLIKFSLNRRFISDDLSHMLLFLGGISCKDYKDELNILSPKYKNKKVLLKGSTNYDYLFENSKHP